ncbi:hypothetical protein [Bowmanella denitrificans]|uniref:hypothetical protein n=1 Tax=Bowmanella denitrificans TaxID=366582 RepID=UPI000C9C3FA0|nr:hypothetical protein [Bowmanella denitrificans]
MKYFLIVILCAFSTRFAIAAPAWYTGEVSRIALLKGEGFVLTFANNSLDDCEEKYAYFSNDHIDEVEVQRAYSLALTSLTTGLQMGVVVDKQALGSDGRCYATGMVADLRKG